MHYKQKLLYIYRSDRCIPESNITVRLGQAQRQLLKFNKTSITKVINRQSGFFLLFLKFPNGGDSFDLYLYCFLHRYIKNKNGQAGGGLNVNQNLVKFREDLNKISNIISFQFKKGGK